MVKYCLKKDRIILSFFKNDLLFLFCLIKYNYDVLEKVMLDGKDDFFG